MIPNLDMNHEQLVTFCHKWHIDELSVFGSVLREDFNDASDVDFLVVFAADSRTTLFDLVEMRDEMRDILGRPVDIIGKRVVERSQNPYRRDSILGSYEVLYAA